VAVAEELHFGRAARRVHVAQPALSQQIQKLEREIGVQLLERTKRRVALTEAGLAFLEEARRTLASASFAVETARAAAAGEVGRLRIGYTDRAVNLSFPAIVRRFRERFPHVHLHISELHGIPQREALARGELDLGGWAMRGHDWADYDAQLTDDELLHIVLPGDHALVQQDAVALHELRTDPWVLFPPSLQSTYLQLVMRECASSGFTPQVVQEATTLQTLAALVSAGLGVSLLPESICRHTRENVVVKPLAGKRLSLPYHIVWRKNVLSPAARQFLQVAQEISPVVTQV
jgi:DNA-binding transcriptional LysR family regulator